MTEFETKHGDEREQYESGMQRDKETGKPRFDLIIPADVPYDEQLLTRIAKLLGRGADHYGDRNWEKGSGQEELDRARSSAFRHFMQWFTGEGDEDHAAAVFFNIQAAELFQSRIDEEAEDDPVHEVDVVWEAPNTGFTVWSEDGTRMWWVPNYDADTNTWRDQPATTPLADITRWTDVGWVDGDLPDWAYGGKDWPPVKLPSLSEQALTINIKSVPTEVMNLAFGGGKHRRPVPVDSPVDIEIPLPDPPAESYAMKWVREYDQHPLDSAIIPRTYPRVTVAEDDLVQQPSVMDEVLKALVVPTAEQQAIMDSVWKQRHFLFENGFSPYAVMLPGYPPEREEDRITQLFGLVVEYHPTVREALVVTQEQFWDGAWIQDQTQQEEPVRPPVDLRD
jgi:hypothetical protein